MPKLDAARSVRESYHVSADDDEYDDILNNARQKTGTGKCISNPMQSNSVEEQFAAKETRLRVRMRLNRQGLKGWESTRLTHSFFHQPFNSHMMDHPCNDYHTRPSFHVQFTWN